LSATASPNSVPSGAARRAASVTGSSVSVSSGAAARLGAAEARRAQRLILELAKARGAAAMAEEARGTPGVK
jgi:hypothetical protein